MILFVGTEQRGFFVRESASMKGMEMEYIESCPSIRLQLSRISGDRHRAVCGHV